MSNIRLEAQNATYYLSPQEGASREVAGPIGVLHAISELSRQFDPANVAAIIAEERQPSEEWQRDLPRPDEKILRASLALSTFLELMSIAVRVEFRIPVGQDTLAQVPELQALVRRFAPLASAVMQPQNHREAGR